MLILVEEGLMGRVIVLKAQKAVSNLDMGLKMSLSCVICNLRPVRCLRMINLLLVFLLDLIELIPMALVKLGGVVEYCVVVFFLVVGC